jgi:sialidase-1
MTADATCSDPVYTYGGYSSMAKTADYHVGALVERRKKSDERYEIEFHRFNLGFILHGAKEPF